MRINSLRKFVHQHLALCFVAATIVLLVALAATFYQSTQRSTGAVQSIIHTEEVDRYLSLLQVDIIEGKSSSLVYTFTGDESSHDSFQQVLDRTAANLKTVRELTADDLRQQRTLRQAEHLIAEYSAVMRSITELRRKQAIQAAVLLLRTKGEPLLNEIRLRFQEMTDLGRKSLDEAYARTAADTRSTKILLRIIFAATLTLLLAAFWFLARSLTQKRLEAQRESFFQLSLDMLCFAGFDGYFQRLNPAWEKTLGYTVEELMSKPQIEFVHPEDRALTLREAAAIRSGATGVSFENRFVCKDGSYKWLLWNAVPIPGQQVVYAAARDLTERKRTEELLQELALTDELTKLSNRRGFLLLAEQELKLVRGGRRDDHLWLIFADVDGLKQINDEMGHDVGSQAIVNAAGILTTSFRKADVIARMGGDEFAILALDNNPDGGRMMSERVQETVRQFNAEKHLPYPVSLSIGVVKIEAEGVTSIEELLNDADRKMYEHKRSKKKDVVPDQSKTPVL
jgi:diguanylate cyclase (GGDEF)-like protein/PAS domain S-box-containing protein